MARAKGFEGELQEDATSDHNVKFDEFMDKRVGARRSKSRFWCTRVRL